jgi:ABC-type transport system involved in multi-copper enzyme maturation permease subunit
MRTLDRTDRSSPASALLPFFREEYLRIMRSRLALLIWAMMLYTLVAIPFLVQKPQPELVRAVEAWLGAEAIPSKLVLFIWVDGAMNKFAFVLGPVLAGGIIVEESARGLLDLLASKPIRAGDYFTVKLAAAGAAFATFYAAAVLAAVPVFSWCVPGFDAGDFLALSAVHLFAALFAVVFSGTTAVVIGRKLPGMLVSVTVLGTLVGFAFLGFIYPAYRGVSYLNPFFNGIVLIGSVDHYGTWDVLQPIGVLVLFILAFAWLGRWRAAALLEGG